MSEWTDADHWRTVSEMRLTEIEELRRQVKRLQSPVIEVSSAAYKEIWEKLVEAGYDYLVWPDSGQIAMDGFILKSLR